MSKLGILPTVFERLKTLHPRGDEFSTADCQELLGQLYEHCQGKSYVGRSGIKKYRASRRFGRIQVKIGMVDNQWTILELHRDGYLPGVEPDIADWLPTRLNEFS